MRIWIIKVNEPVPEENVRLMRAGMIAREFAARGADVTWWTSTFSHNQPAKEYIAEPGECRTVMNGVTLRFVHGPPYRKNVSFARIRHHRHLALDFKAQAPNLPAPNLIFCAYPPIEIVDEATRFGKQLGIPVIVDVRDLWPDAFLDVTPVPRPIMRLALSPIYARARRTLARATALTAITDPFLDRALLHADRPRRSTDQVVHHAYERSTPALAQREHALDFWKQMGLSFDKSQKIACFFGNLSPTPDLDTPVAALSHLPDVLENTLKMVICGSGEKLDWLREKGKIHKQLIVPGRVGQAEINVLLEKAHLGLLIYPNRDDLLISYPNKVGEYLSGALPILSTLDGLSGALLRTENIGSTSPSGDPIRFAQQLEALLCDEERYAAMKRNADRVYTERFDAEHVYSQLVDGLLNLAEQSTK